MDHDEMSLRARIMQVITIKSKLSSEKSERKEKK